MRDNSERSDNQAGARLVRWDSRPVGDPMYGSDTPGFYRWHTAPVHGTGIRAHVVVLPEGQGSPRHAGNCEILVFQVDGTVEYVLSENRFVLKPNDMLLIPKDVIFSYENVGDGDARFLSIVARVDEWPAKGMFFDD